MIFFNPLPNCFPAFTLTRKNGGGGLRIKCHPKKTYVCELIHFSNSVIPTTEFEQRVTFYN